jgi:putative hydrolase of the HAD superfamily
MIFFDIDQTLINHQHAQDAAALLFLKQFAHLLPYSPKDFGKLWQSLMKKHFATFTRGEINFIEHRRRRIKELFQEAETDITDAEADMRFAVYLQYYEDNWLLYDDVLPCLNLLSNHKLGIISNGNTEQQTRKLYQTGILGRFDIIVVSEEVGVSKPKPDIFLIAGCQAKVTMQQCTYIGDSLQNDALAAQAVGMQSIWLNRKEYFSPEVPVPMIKNLYELVAVS